MQANQLSVQTDPLNNGTIVPEPYDRYEEYQNRSVYIGASHTPDTRDTISLYRSFPTKSGNFKGVSKSSVKLTKDHLVLGVDGVSNLTSPVIVEVNFSVPLGVTAANLLEIRQRVIALLDDDSMMDALSIQLMV